MTNTAITDNVWQAIKKELFAALGMAAEGGQWSTADIIDLVDDKK